MAELDNGTTRTWHALSAADCLSALQTDPRGLTETEAQVRLARHGPNQVSISKPPSALSRLARQLNNPLLFVLLGAAVITISLQHWTDTAVIVGVVVINALVGFIQEGRAEKALLSIAHLLTPVCEVMREGEVKEIAAHQLVPGDIVLLSSGDRVPADLRLLGCNNLEIDESILTGESVPVIKRPGSAIPADGTVRPQRHGTRGHAGHPGRRPGVGMRHGNRHFSGADIGSAAADRAHTNPAAAEVRPSRSTAVVPDHRPGSGHCRLMASACAAWP